MTPQTRHSPAPDPWHGKRERFWLIGAISLLGCLVFAAYDGNGFHARYMRLCAEHPASRECRPLNLVKEERPSARGVTLDFGKGKWALEAGPLQDEASANSLAAGLRSMGVEPRVIKLPGKQRKMSYQVQFGRFLSRKDVGEAGAQLRAKGVIQDFRVVEYRASR